MTFKELFQTGQCSISAIDAWSEIWHGRAGMAQSLQAFLGLSDEEYHVWLVEGNAGLAQTLNRGHMPAYETVYLSWDELTAQLQEIVDAELGPGFTVDLRRQDFYYWDMRLETAHKMNEALSEKICACLDLRDVDVLVFLEDDWVDNNCLCGLLSKLTHREVTSSHADDHGVWIICKSLVWSSPEFTAYLLTKCEHRLRREIGDRHYSLVNQDTACHQLFGFMEALVMLGLLERDKLFVRPDHFAPKVDEEGLETDLLKKVVRSYCTEFLKTAIYGECKAFCPFHKVNNKESDLQMCSDRYIKEHPDRVKKILEQAGVTMPKE